MRIMEQPKQRFLEICVSNGFDSAMMQIIADLAGVARSIVDTMFVGTAVERLDAEKVLGIVSQYVGQTLSLENVDVPVVDVVETQMNKSEVANLMAQIQAEYEAGQLALRGLAQGTSKHAFITRRMENMATYMDELKAAIGEEAALQAMINLQDEATSEGKNI